MDFYDYSDLREACDDAYERGYKDGQRDMINSRQKGKRGELEIAHILQEHGFDARRSQQYAGINNDADVVGLPNVHIEVKRVQALNIDKAMAQSEHDARENEIPVVMHRKDRQPWRVTLNLEDFIELYKKVIPKNRNKSE